MNNEIEKIFKDIISKVNSTLNFYEKDYVSAKRTNSTTVNERCSSFEQYVEIRFNKECCNIPELENLVEGTDGHLFKCIELEDQNTAKRNFKKATIIVNPDLLLSEDEDLKRELEKAKDFLSFNKLQFNSVKKKIKIKII